MNIKQIVTGVLGKLEQEGYYSEVSTKALKESIQTYLETEYQNAVHKQSIILEEEKILKGKDLPDERYNRSYEKIEDALVDATKKVAACSKEDLELEL